MIEYRFETALCYKHTVFIVHLSFLIFNQPIFYIILGSSKSQPECGPTLTRRMDRRTWWGNRSQILCKRKKGSQNVGAVSWMWWFKIEMSFLICFLFRPGFRPPPAGAMPGMPPPNYSRPPPTFSRPPPGPLPPGVPPPGMPPPNFNRPPSNFPPPGPPPSGMPPPSTFSQPPPNFPR